VGPAGQCLGGDHAAQVVLDVEAVDGARGGAVEHHAEGTAVGLVVRAHREVLGRGTVLGEVDRVDPRQVGGGLPQHVAAASLGDDDVRAAVRGGRQVRGLAGRELLAGDDHAGVGVDVEGVVVAGRETHRDHRVVDRAEFGAAVVVTDDPFGGPSVLGVAVG